MFKTREKPCAGRCRFGHPVQKPKTRRRGGVGMFRRDKTSLSGRLRRFSKGVLKHRPRSGVGAIMSRAGAWVSRLAGHGRGLAPGTAPGQGLGFAGAGSGHQARPVRSRTTPHSLPTRQTGQQRQREPPGKGGPWENPFRGHFRGCSVRFDAGEGTATGQATAHTRHTAPGEGVTKGQRQGHQIGQHMGQGWQKMGPVCM